MRSTIIILLLMLFSWHSHAAELDQAATRQLTDKAMALFVANKLKEGYRVFVPHWPLPESEINTLIEQTEKQWSIVSSRFGTSAGYEFIATKRAGNSLIRHIYIQKFTNHAIRWQFTFYKPNNKWRVNSIVFDDQIGNLFN